MAPSQAIVGILGDEDAQYFVRVIDKQTYMW